MANISGALQDGIVGFIHHFNGNIIVLVAANNSFKFQLSTSNKIDKSFGVTRNYLSNGVIKSDVEKFRLKDNLTVFEMYKTLSF